MSNTSLLAGWRQRWNTSLFQFLRQRVRESVDVEDLAQETYLRLLRLRDDRPCQEIAQQLSLTDRQVKRHLARGYDQLRARLEGPEK